MCDPGGDTGIGLQPAPLTCCSTPQGSDSEVPLAPNLPVAQAKNFGGFLAASSSHLPSPSTQPSPPPVQAMATISCLDTCSRLLPGLPHPQSLWGSHRWLLKTPSRTQFLAWEPPPCSHIGALLFFPLETLFQPTLFLVKGSLDPTHWSNSFSSLQPCLTVSL